MDNKRVQRKNRWKQAGMKALVAGLAMWQLWSAPLWPSLAYAQTAATQVPVLVQQDQQPITAGAMLKTYQWQGVRSGQTVTADVRVIEIDLWNPWVQLDVMTGKENQFTRKQPVLGMARETGAAAGINGDFFNMNADGAPLGPQISNGVLMSSPSYLYGMYSFAITSDRKPIIDLFTFTGTVTAQDGSSYPLAGINKAVYWHEETGAHSHADALHLYTSAWGQTYRAIDGSTTPTEVLVVDGVVQQIVPNGIIDSLPPENGYILRASGKAATFVMEHLKVGDRIRADYKLLPQDPSKNYDGTTFQMMIGGHTILVDEGKPTAYSRNVSSLTGYRARTAIGYSQDQRYVYLITVDYNGNSKGMSLKELQETMVQLGVWKGMNLDGGGSTQMVARPLGETQAVLVNRPESNYQRSVVNGLGVYSLAPAGQLAGLIVNPEETMFMGERLVLNLKGYDEFYNPVAPENIVANWSSSQPIGSFVEPNTFLATATGQTVLTAKAGTAVAQVQVQVVGRKGLQKLEITAVPAIPKAGSEVTLNVKATANNGVTKQIQADTLQWEFHGLSGTISGNTLRVESINPGTPAMLIGRYDGFSTVLTIPFGSEQLWADFDEVDRPLSVAATDGVSATIGKRISYEGDYNFTVEFRYDLSGGTTDTKAAYAVIGDPAGTQLDGVPVKMEMDVKGDGSNNWLRAEFQDVSGKIHYVDLARKIDWTGWKTVQADLSSLSLAEPVKLRRIYVVSVGQNEQQAMSGTIYLDNIRFHFLSDWAVPERNHVSLVIDQQQIMINGQAHLIDQAPVIVEGNTLVPVRFVTEALGGTVTWNEAEQRVTIMRGGQVVDFWIGDKDFVADGRRITAEVPPQLMNGRSMIPLRVLSEHLGWTVTWDGSTRTVTLE